MQESTGNVGVQTTTAPDGSQSAGLMQAAGSPGFPGQHGLSQVCIGACYKTDKGGANLSQGSN